MMFHKEAGHGILLVLGLLLSSCGKADQTQQGTSGAPSGKQSAGEVASEMKNVAIQPGEWESVQEITDVAVEGAPKGMPQGMMDAMKGRKTTVRTCITPEQAAKPGADFLTAQKNSKCTYSGFEMSGGAIKGTVSCPGANGGSATIAMQGIYGPASYAMTMDMRSESVGGPHMSGMVMHMKMKTTGRRVGDCAKK